MTTIASGPYVYENWVAADAGLPAHIIYEIPLMSDSRFLGDAPDGYGPYQFINAINTSQSPFLFSPSVVLRVAEHFVSAGPPSMRETDTTRYHGGGLGDEVAALVSLLLGVRVIAAGVSRRFELRRGADPKGRPIALYGGPELSALLRPPRRILPHIPEQVNLDGLHRLVTLPRMDPKAAVALVKAARLYQEALTVAEPAPATAWLLFVSSVETAANYAFVETVGPIERVRQANPDLATLLDEAGGSDLLGRVASEIADSLGSTGKFVRFVLHHLPDPPTLRPAEWVQAAWGRNDMRGALRKIYGHRSAALHGGTPFPEPMCESPAIMEGWDAPAEKPMALSASAKGGTWVADDTPMLLHTFEYIVRGALLRWWSEATPIGHTTGEALPSPPAQAIDGA